MTITRRRLLYALLLALLPLFTGNAQINSLPTPEQFLGHRVGADKKLARWDKIVEYSQLVAKNSDRVRFRELGKTTLNNPFIALEISAAATLKDLERYKQLERKLYFQGGAPTDASRNSGGKVKSVAAVS